MKIIAKPESQVLHMVDANEKHVGELNYMVKDQKMIIIDSTQVDPLYKGQKIGDQLVEAVVKFARDAQKKIIPLCPFAKAYFEKRPDQYTDLLDK